MPPTLRSPPLVPPYNKPVVGIVFAGSATSPQPILLPACVMKNRARSDDAAVHFATKKTLNPTDDDSVTGAGAINAVALPDGNVTADRPLMVPILNAEPPALEVAV